MIGLAISHFLILEKLGEGGKEAAMGPMSRWRLSRSILLFASLTVPPFFFNPQTLQSQFIPHAIIRGRVFDDSTRAPLPLTNVFISNSTIGTAADAEGGFELKGVPFGTQEIVASIVGYAPQTKILRLTDSSTYEVEFRLKQRPVQIPGLEVEAKAPKKWKRYLRRFIDVFFGSTPNAEQCRLLNPEVLDFALADPDIFTATARAPLEIENRALGYRIQCFLDFFSDAPTVVFPVVDMTLPSIPRKTEYVYRTRFTPLEPENEEELTRWKENRRKTYYGSERHFLYSLVRKNCKAAGFEVDSVYSRLRGSPIWTAVNADKLFGRGDFVFERKLFFSGVLEVVYKADGVTQNSIIQLSQPIVVVQTDGLLADPLSITTYGYWATQRAAEMLPIDYSPDE
jgi:hypothetical protein